MDSAKLENLVRLGQLKKELPRAEELDGLKRSGLARLTDGVPATSVGVNASAVCRV